MNSLTREQQQVVDNVCSTGDDRIIAVNSIAGSGKTSTAAAVINAYKPVNGFYTAFNKAIILDSAKKFGKQLDCKTVHALAYSHIRPSRNIEDLTYTTIKENIGYDNKSFIISTIDNFFRSPSTNIYEFTKDAVEGTDKEPYSHLIEDYVNMMLAGKIPPTFNYMLKCLHVMLVNKEIEIDYDLLILDECQDTTAVTLEIFKNIDANKKVMFGDKYQNIYSFMDTVNAFEELNNLNLHRLTKSFRCNPEIADIVEQFGSSYLEKDFLFKGNECIDNDINSIAYITRTNSSLIERMHTLINEGKRFSITRSLNDIFALPIALANASCGNPVYDKKYKYLEMEYKSFKNSSTEYRNFFIYLMSVMGEDSIIENTIKTLLNFNSKRINIFDLKEKAKNIKPDPKVILTTAHAFKGLEADAVYIENDLNVSVNKAIDIINRKRSFMQNVKDSNIDSIREDLNTSIKEDLNTYYVALSRARSVITNVDYN